MPLEPMELAHDGKRLVGQVAKPAGEGPFPTVLVMHSGVGIDEFNFDKARKLADRGFLAVATDMYGADVDLDDEASFGGAFQSLLDSPETLRSRLLAWFNAIAAREDVDASRMAAIGYCFGGYCVLELARTGADCRAVVSYHGLLSTSAPAQPGAVKAHVAAYCGGNDPYAPLDHVTALGKELTDAGASFSITVFGEAEHGFTDPDAVRHGRPGISYNAIAAKTSWAGTLALLDEVLA
ncbi:MAG: dienelactone hydrolase family protein [Novosphingobium sp.]